MHGARKLTITLTLAILATLASVLGTGCATGVEDDYRQPAAQSSGDAATDSETTPSFGDDSSTPTVDGAIDAPPPTIALCNDRRCRSDQACVKDECTSKCTGVKVPGDYATVSAAVTAIAPSGGTICVGEGSFTDAVYLSASSTVTIVGASNTRTTLGRIAVSGTKGTLVLRTLTIGDSVQTDGTTLSMAGVRITPAVSGRAALTIRTASGVTPFNVQLDGCDLQASKGYAAVSIYDGGYGNFDVRVQNSWLHDSRAGVEVQHAAPSGSKAALKLINDTLTKNDTALSVMRISGSGTVDLTYVNDLFVDNGVAINLTAGTVAATHHHDAFHGNTTNYSGMATPGVGYVTDDPLMNELSTPPSLKPGSPCRAAADPIVAPDSDYWGVVRSKKFDIGAVQSIY